LEEFSEIWNAFKGQHDSDEEEELLEHEEPSDSESAVEDVDTPPAAVKEPG